MTELTSAIELHGRLSFLTLRCRAKKNVTSPKPHKTYEKSPIRRVF
jgi:hypothetical protein